MRILSISEICTPRLTGSVGGPGSRRYLTAARNIAVLLFVCLAAVDPAQAQRVVLGGNPQGSQLYPMSNAIGSVVTRYSPLRVDVLPQGAGVFYPMMASAEVDFGMVNPMDALSAARGDPPYDRASRGRGFPIETLMLGSPIPLSIVAAGDSGIESVADLAGRRLVADYGAFASAGLTADAVLASAGLDRDDVEVVTVSSYPEGVRAVIEGRADAATGSVGSAIIRELELARGAKFLSVANDTEALARVQAIGSAFTPYLAEAGAPGLAEATWVLAYDVPIIVRSDLDEQVAYDFVKALWDHHAELARIYAPLATWTPDRFASTQALIPYHAGAVRFYREHGVWSESLETRQRTLSTRE